MRYLSIKPSARLSPFVRSFWVYEGEASLTEPYIYRGYADGCGEIVFHYRGVYDRLTEIGVTEKAPAAGVQAPSRTYSRYVIDRDFSIFGCYFYPYAIPLFFSYSAVDLVDRFTDLESVLGPIGRELEQRMLSTTQTDEHVAILTRFLERRLDVATRGEDRVFAAIGHVIESKGQANVREMSERYFFSHRQFERKFKEYSGFSPKLYTRIIRFQAALKHYGSAKSMTEIAHETGYYDQSHFISDFREFSGYSPKAFFSGIAEGAEYLDA